MNMASSKSIHCTNIPRDFLDKTLAKQYFSNFGQIHRFILRPSSLACTVEYETAAEAKYALDKAGEFNGHCFEVGQIQPATLRNTDSAAMDPDVAAELLSMNGGRSILPSRNPLKSFMKQDRTPAMPHISSMKLPTTFSKPSSVEAMTTMQPKSPIMIHNMNRFELEQLVATPALGADQKYRALDARDRLLRLNMERTTDIKKVKSTKGSCPDMCPEKERWMREAKHQVAVFEMDPHRRHVIDHSQAVKQYSRSSADQEMPLAHDLRSEPVLRMTMTYLLHEIADLCDSPDVNITDWFHFLWDRTRSIRKDITQQELCCQGSVRLVEQCARFHIHCAGRLLAEEPQVFDQRINTENLTKCLQSLKYMYHDLALKNESCPKEAEFRAYIILLNLHDSNFLWEVKQLPAAVQCSAEVKFAIEVYLAMANNNYVQFFKLVRRTTYLNACVLLRYFNQVRAQATATIVKAYTVKASTDNRAVPYTLSELTYTLAFEDCAVAAQFFEYYSLRVDLDEDRVYLDRDHFCHPDMPFLLDRAINIVEQKRQTSVGTVIAGGDVLPPKSIYVDHRPQNSFDMRGLLKTPHLQVTVPDDAPRQEFKMPSPVAKPFEMAVPKTVFFAANHVKDQGYGDPDDVDDYEEEDAAEEEEDEDLDNDGIDENGEEDYGEDEDYGDGMAEEEVFDEEEQTYETEKLKEVTINWQEEAEQRREEILSRIQLDADRLWQQLIDEEVKIVVREQAERICEHHKNILQECEAKTEAFLQEVIAEEVSVVARDECLLYHSDEFARQKLLQRVFRGWRHRAMDTRKNRAKFSMAPAWLPYPTSNDMIVSHQSEALLDICRYRKGASFRTSSVMSSQWPASKLNLKSVIAPLLMAGGVPSPRYYFKAIISVPGPDEETFGYNSFFRSFLRKLLNDDDSPPPNEPFLLRQDKLNDSQCLSTCIRLVQGRALLTENETALAATAENIDGVLFLMVEPTVVGTSKERLNRLLGKFVKSQLPIVVLNVGSAMNPDTLRVDLGLDSLEEEQEIGPSSVQVLDNKYSLDRSLQSALMFLAAQTKVPYPTLRARSIGSVLAEGVGDCFWKRLEINASVNPSVREVTANYGSIVVAIYNEAVDRVAGICAPDYSEYLDFPAEFRSMMADQSPAICPIKTYSQFAADWRSPERRSKVTELCVSLKLPQSHQLENRADDVRPIVERLREYVSQIFDKDAADVVLLRIIEAQGPATDGKLEWLDALRIITGHLLRQRLHEAGTDSDSECVYDEEEMKRFLQFPWWLQTAIMKRKFQRESDSTDPAVKRRRMPESQQCQSTDIEAVIERANASLAKAEQFTRNFKRNKAMVESITRKYEQHLQNILL